MTEVKVFFLGFFYCHSLARVFESKLPIIDDFSVYCFIYVPLILEFHR